MTRQALERKRQPWVCHTCGTTNFSPHSTQCAVCFSPAPNAREKRHVPRRIMLIGGLVTGATLLGGGGFWMASSLLSRQSQPQPGQAMWEVLLDSGSTLGVGDLGAPALAWSPDGTSIACTSMLGKPVNKGVMVVDAKTAQIRWTHQEAPFWFDALAWSPDGTRLALAGRSRPESTPRPSFIQIWQVQGWQKVAEYPIVKSDTQGHLACGQLAWSPDGARLAGFNDSVDSQVSPSVQIWNASNGEVLFRQEPMGSGGNLFLSWLPDGHGLATSWQQGELDISDTRTGASLFHREPDVPSASRGNVPLLLFGPAAALSPDGQRAALYLLEQGHLVIQVWDLRTASPLFSCQPVAGQHWCLTWSSDGNYLAECQSNSSPASIRFWNANTGKLAFSYEALSFPNRLTWSPNGRFLAMVDNHQPGSFIFRAPMTNIVLRVLEIKQSAILK